MSFRIKKEKKPKKIPILLKSIEEIHEEKMQYFLHLQESIPDKIKESIESIESISLKKELDSIVNKEEETKYLLNVMDILYKYDQQDSDKEELKRRYYDVVGLNYNVRGRDKQIDTCINCEALIDQAECCSSCGTVYNNIQIGKPSFKETQNITLIQPCVYKRINYFKDMLNMYMGVQKIDIPVALLNNVKLEFKKKLIIDSSNVDTKLMKKILKDLGQNKYYEHSRLIISKVFNYPLTTLSSETIDNLITMFTVLQKPFEDNKGTRKSFLSYPYVFYKLFELLDLNEYMENHDLLKNRDKLIKQEIIWKRMMTELEKIDATLWRFIPTC